MSKLIKLSRNFIIIGIVLMIIAVIMNDGKIPLFANHYEEKHYVKLADNIKSINIDAINDDVTIEPNDSDNIEISYYDSHISQYKITDNDSTLTIKEQDDNILKLIHGTISQYAFAELDGRIRQTVKELLDANFQSEIDLKKKILSELERANLMSLKNYILQNPGLDPTEYKAYYYQSKGESQKISKGQLQVESLIERTRMENDLKALDDWKKAITEGEDE